MTKSTEWTKRRLLFETYAKNLGIVKRHPRIHIEPDVDDIFLCPQCFQYFTRDEVLAENTEDTVVTVEHVPPEALGGKERTLTCKQCNSWAGHELDSHLAHKLDLLDFTQGLPGSSVDAKIKVNDDINLTATIQFGTDRQMNIISDPDRSDPKEIRRLAELGAPGPQSFEITFRGKRGKPHRLRRPECSLLRIAYLWAFSVFGYGFLISNSLSSIRGQIKNPNDSILSNWGISQRDDFPDESLGVNIIVAPNELRSFLVVFDLQTSARTRRFGVMLPGPTAPSTTIYAALQEFAKSTDVVPIIYKPIPSTTDFLTQPNLCFVSHDIWDTWRSP